MSVIYVFLYHGTVEIFILIGSIVVNEGVGVWMPPWNPNPDPSPGIEGRLGFIKKITKINRHRKTLGIKQATKTRSRDRNPEIQQ